MPLLHGLCNLFCLRKSNWPADILKQHQPLRASPLLSLREGFCEPWLYLEELESVKPIFLAPLTSNSYEEIEKELLTVGFNLGLAYFELS